jgi:hypothetical protein
LGLTIKYRVYYHESESGWSSDSWNTDYDTEQEARTAFKECWDTYMEKGIVPDYYIRPTYIGKVEV